MPRFVLPILIAAVVAIGSSVVQAQGVFDPSFGGFGPADDFGGQAQDPVSIEAQFTTATADRPAVLMVTATIIPEWHVYSITQPEGGPKRTELKLMPSDQYRPIGNWAASAEPYSYIDKAIFKGVRIEEHEEEVTWYVPIELAKGVEPENLVINGSYALQACKQSCLTLKGAFAAKLGTGVKIGPIQVTIPTDVTASDKKAETKPKLPTPPENAGLFRAEKSIVTWYGWLDRNTAIPGQRVHFYLRAEMPENWHINAYAKRKATSGNQPTLIVPEPAGGLQFYRPEPLAKVIEKQSPIEGFGLLQYHEQVAAWVIPIDVAEDAKPGSYKVSGLVGYQACQSDEQGLGSCELQTGIEFSGSLKVAPLASDAQPSGLVFTTGEYSEAAQLAEQHSDDLQQADSNLKIIEFGGEESADLGFIGTIGFALIGGLILNLMPCVLPVIGLKLMSFAKQGGESRVRVFSLNLAYVMGMLAVFLLLATLASLPQLGLTKTLDYDWGELNTQTWYKVSMSVLVFVMALSFLGVWEIPIPGFAGSSKAAEMASREGFGGAFFKGILTTILATPCSGPFLGPVFGYTLGESATTTYAIFMAVGLGMASPYLVIGLFPRLVQWIPKPGAWMDTFKQGMAFLLLGTVVYLISWLEPDYFIPTLALLVACWFACWLGGRLPITASGFSRAMSWFVGITTAVAVGLVGFGPKSEYELPWQDYSPTQLADAQGTGNVVLLEFTADWCPTCKVNLATALDVRAVQRVVEANDVQTVKADWTDESPEIEASLELLNSRSIPLLAVYPAGRPNEVIVLRDLVSKKQVLQALAAAGAREQNPQGDYELEPKRQSEDQDGERLAIAP